MAVSLYVSYVLNSQSVANNTSNVTVKASVKWTNGSWNATGQCTGSLTIDGTKYSFSGMKFNTGKTSSGSAVVMTKTVTDIKHNADGTKSLPISAEFNTYISAGTIAASATPTLTTIPRKSTLTVANGTLGTSQTVSVTRQSTSFTHSIKATCGNSTIYINADGTTSVSEVKHNDCSIPFTPPLTWASQNKTGTSVSVTYTLKTYNGSTAVGTETYTKTCSIPASVKPSCTVTVSDPTGYATQYGGYIKGLSKFAVTVNPTVANGSPIKAYKATANGCGYNEASFTTDVIKSYGTLSITATVTDQRGRTSDTATKNVTVLNYIKPGVTKLVAERCDANGTKNDRGDRIKVTFAITGTSLGGKNTVLCSLKYRKSTDSAYTTPTDFSGIASSYMFEADVNSSYDISMTVSDDFNTVTKVTKASTGFTLMHWKADGTAMGIGKLAETSNQLDVGLPASFSESVTFANAKSIYGTSLDGTSYDAFIPITSSDNTTLGYGLYNAGKGATNLYGNRINFYTKNGIYTNNNNLNFNNAIDICGYDTDGTTLKHVFTAQSENGNTTVGYDNYNKKSGNTHLYGYDLNFYVSNIASPGSYRPYRRRGDSITFTVKTAGYITNSGKDVEFFLPLSMPVIGSPTVTATSGNGFLLRQNNSYTHGSAWNSSSSSYTYAKPTKYSCSLYMYGGVFITATFSAATNATNNSPIGIYWNGTITFT